MVDPSVDSDPSGLGLTWSVQDYSETSLQIMLQFYQPLAVSSAGGNDKVLIRLQSEQWFYDEYGQTLPSDTLLEASIPRQFPSAEEKERVQ